MKLIYLILIIVLSSCAPTNGTVSGKRVKDQERKQYNNKNDWSNYYHISEPRKKKDGFHKKKYR